MSVLLGKPSGSVHRGTRTLNAVCAHASCMRVPRRRTARNTIIRVRVMCSKGLIFSPRTRRASMKILLLITHSTSSPSATGWVDITPRVCRCAAYAHVRTPRLFCGNPQLLYNAYWRRPCKRIIIIHRRTRPRGYTYWHCVVVDFVRHSARDDARDYETYGLYQHSRSEFRTGEKINTFP